MIRKILALSCILVLVCVFTACNSEPKIPEFDYNGYLEALLDSKFKAQNEELGNFTHDLDEVLTENNIITVENASSRFFSKLELNPSDVQINKMNDVFKQIYAQVKYTLGEERKVTDGYFISVEFAPISNISDLSDDINDIKLNSGLERFEKGAKYIDDIILLCENAIANPIYSEIEIVDIHILIENNSKYYIDKKAVNTIDEHIVKFE